MPVLFKESGEGVFRGKGPIKLIPLGSGGGQTVGFRGEGFREFREEHLPQSAVDHAHAAFLPFPVLKKQSVKGQGVEPLIGENHDRSLDIDGVTQAEHCRILERVGAQLRQERRFRFSGNFNKARTRGIKVQ